MKNLDLSEFVPFNLTVDRRTSLILEANNIPLTYATRNLYDMKSVIYDEEWLLEQQNDIKLYHMYRDFTREEDKPLFNKHQIRFDITIILPKYLGKEYTKTVGHFHPEIKKGLSYPEVYEIMSGIGLYLLQKEVTSSEPIELITIQGKKGDQILIPPGYGHVTINPSEDEILVMNNLVSSEFNSIYGSIKDMKGASYYYLKGEKWIKNENYKQEVIMKKKTPLKLSMEPFYLSFLDNPDQWKFLNEPWTKNNW